MAIKPSTGKQREMNKTALIGRVTALTPGLRPGFHLRVGAHDVYCMLVEPGQTLPRLNQTVRAHGVWSSAITDYFEVARFELAEPESDT
jgi:hypothetical protein